jgi:predicted ATPase
MADNGSKTRPVRTLTVKNFSVIKEAKLELGKITVLIGPQASGKSLRRLIVGPILMGRLSENSRQGVQEQIPDGWVAQNQHQSRLYVAAVFRDP